MMLWLVKLGHTYLKKEIAGITLYSPPRSRIFGTRLMIQNLAVRDGRPHRRRTLQTSERIVLSNDQSESRCAAFVFVASQFSPETYEVV